MRVRAQIGMVLNLDKCIGCHTCSVTCKNVWTSRPGMEYAWFNNVETKPGIGYPKEWENQDKWNGGWVRKADGSIEPRQGARWKLLMRIFANPNLPQIDDYYEPFTFDYDHLQSAPEMKAAPTARPRSLITGQRMEKIEWGPNWEEILGGEFAVAEQADHREAEEDRRHDVDLDRDPPLGGAEDGDHDDQGAQEDLGPRPDADQLQEVDGDAGFFCQLLQTRVDVSQGLAAIDAGLALAEQIEVGAVQDEDAHAGGRRLRPRHTDKGRTLAAIRHEKAWV